MPSTVPVLMAEPPPETEKLAIFQRPAPLVRISLPSIVTVPAALRAIVVSLAWPRLRAASWTVSLVRTAWSIA